MTKHKNVGAINPWHIIAGETDIRVDEKWRVLVIQGDQIITV